MLPKLDVPIYSVTLLSTGKEVRIRPFLVKEQKLFLMAAESEDSKETINTINQYVYHNIIFFHLFILLNHFKCRVF